MLSCSQHSLFVEHIQSSIGWLFVFFSWLIYRHIFPLTSGDLLAGRGFYLICGWSDFAAYFKHIDLARYSDFKKEAMFYMVCFLKSLLYLFQGRCSLWIFSFQYHYSSLECICDHCLLTGVYLNCRDLNFYLCVCWSCQCLGSCKVISTPKFCPPSQAASLWPIKESKLFF